MEQHRRDTVGDGNRPSSIAAQRRAVHKRMKKIGAPVHLTKMALILLENAEGDGWQAACNMIAYAEREVRTGSEGGTHEAR